MNRRAFIATAVGALAVGSQSARASSIPRSVSTSHQSSRGESTTTTAIFQLPDETARAAVGYVVVENTGTETVEATVTLRDITNWETVAHSGGQVSIEPGAVAVIDGHEAASTLRNNALIVEFFEASDGPASVQIDAGAHLIA